MEKKRKQTDMRSFLSSKRIDSSPQFESEIEIMDVNSAGDLEKSQICDIQETSDASGIAVENSVPSGILCESVNGLGKGETDIGCAVGLFLKPEQRYKLLTEKWKPAEEFEFPYVEIAGRSRRFKGKWLNQNAWLAYSPSKKGGYCLFCVLFNTSLNKVQNQALGSFVTEPWTRFGNVTEELTRHSATEYHRKAAEKAGEFTARYESGDTAGIIGVMDSNIRENIKKNRERLLPIIKTILFCGRNELAFRGHRDDGEILTPKSSTACLQGGHGIFRGLLAFRIDAGDQILQNHLATASKKETLISKTIQNELIEVIGHHIQSELVHQILKARFYTILVDETSDCSKVEQMSFCIRYVDIDTHTLREDFLGFSAVNDTTGAGLKASLCSFLSVVGLDLANCRGQGFDGGSNMSGKFKGLQALVLKEHPKALYTHCFSHELNLSVSKACDIPLVKNTIGTVSTVSAYLSASPQRVDKLQRIVESSERQGTQKKRIRPFCPTRWVERHTSLLTFRGLYEEILETLEEIKGAGDAQSSSLAFAYEAAMKRTDFIITLESLCHVMTFTKNLSVSLQSSDMDLSKAVEQVRVTIRALQQIQKNEKAEFKVIYEKACKLAESVGVTFTVPRVTKRQNFRHPSFSSSPEDYYFESVFSKLLRHFIDDLNHRFSAQARDVFALQGLIPSRLPHYSDDDILAGANFYEKDLTFLSIQDLKAEFALWRAKWNGQKNPPSSALEALQRCDNLTPNISKLLQIFITMPVTTCSVERSFSALKRLKTAARSTMLQPRLNGVALMSIHKTMPIDEIIIVDKFAKAKPRILELRDMSVESVHS